jgi:hypothetical protein
MSGTTEDHIAWLRNQAHAHIERYGAEAVFDDPRILDLVLQLMTGFAAEMVVDNNKRMRAKTH